MPGGRERILDTAYELFSRHGTRAVGVDRIIADAGTAKMTLYRHFASKDELVLAFLAEREERWTRGWLQAEVERRAQQPRERLLAIFDVFGAWFEQRGLRRVLVHQRVARTAPTRVTRGMWPACSIWRTSATS